MPLAYMLMMPVITISNDCKSHVASGFDHLDPINAIGVIDDSINQCHVMSALASHDQKIHVASYLNNLDLANKMVPSV